MQQDTEQRKEMSVGWVAAWASQAVPWEVLAHLIWPLHDLPQGILSPGRKSSCCAARYLPEKNEA